MAAFGRRTQELSALVRCACLVLSFSSIFAAPTLDERTGTGCEALKENEVCCGNRRYPRNYDRVCCPLRGQSYVEGDEAYVYKWKCQDGFTTDSTEKCGSGQHDVRFQDCCGTVPFDRGFHTCCPGRPNPTVVPWGTTCCGGRGLESGEMCCHVYTNSFDDMLPIKKNHSAHTHCCAPLGIENLQEEKDKIETFNNATHYCDLTTGRIKPNFAELPDNNTPICPRGKRLEEGEKLECCFDKPFRPSQKTCCLDFLYDLPSSTSVCCGDEAYHKDDDSNPCINSCGGRRFNQEYQLCCNERIFNASSPRTYCCGSEAVNLDTHECCGEMMPIRRHGWSCCRNTMPYMPRVMHCDSRTGTVSLRQKRLKKYSIPQKMCGLNLDTWGERWVAFTDPKMIKIQGRVERCGIRLKKNKLTIPLVPAMAVVGGEDLSRCLKGKGLKLVIVLPEKGSCSLKKREVKNYLKGRTLEVMVKAGKVHCERKGAKIVLREKEAAFILRSRRMDSLLENVSLYRGV